MNTYNKNLMIFAPLITLNLMPAYASEQELSTKVLGTFQSTTIDVQIPAVSNFIYNPNTEELITGKLTVTSKTNAPIYMSLKDINIDDTSIWQPTLIAPDRYTSGQWRNLTKYQSYHTVALGLNAIYSNQWLSELENDSLWSTDTNNKNRLGIIKNHGVIDTKPLLKSGNAIPLEDGLTANYVFEFGLEEGTLVEIDKTQKDDAKFEIKITDSIKVDKNGQLSLDTAKWKYTGNKKTNITSDSAIYISPNGRTGIYDYTLPSDIKTATFELMVKALRNEGHGMNSSMFIRTMDTGIGFYFYPDKVVIYDDVYSEPIGTYVIDGTTYNTYRIVKENNIATLYINNNRIVQYTLRSGTGYNQQRFFFGDGTSNMGYSEAYYKDIKIAPGQALYLD